MSLLTDLGMFDCLLILFAREKFHRKKEKTDKNVVQWKSFLLKSWCITLK